MPTVETIKCPACGKEIPQDVENCPNCGAPISVIMNNDISGAPIDNSAAIDAMLRSASQFMEESESLGLDEIDIFDENEEDEEGAKEEVFKKVTLKELPPELAELSPQQKNEINAGGVIDLSPPADPTHGQAPAANSAHHGKHKASAGAPAAPAAPSGGGFKDLTASAPQPAVTSQSAPPLSFDDDDDDEGAEAAPAKHKKVKPQKEKKPKKVKNEEPTLYEVDENGNPIKGKKPRKQKAKKEKIKHEKSGSKGGASPAAVVIAAVLRVAVGRGGGYFGKMFFFPDLPTPDCQEFAQKAVNTVLEKLSGDQELYIVEAYVKDGAVSSQCIFRALIENGNSEDISSSWYRVKIDHDNTNPSVSVQLDDEEYERLRNSENSEERARAAVLKSNQNELDRCISEAAVGSGWNSANTSLINSVLHPYSENTQKTETE